MKRILFSLLCVSALAGAVSLGAINCSSTYGYSYPYESAYVYDYYYPADTMYYSYAYTDPWAYGGYYYLDPGIGAVAGTPTYGAGGSGGSGSVATGGTGGTTTDGGATTVRQAIGDTLRALARGENPCPNQNTVTPKRGQPSCRTDGNDVTQGATITFTGCQIAGGATLDGMIDIQATSTASEAICTASTVITVTHTTTVTNLTYTNAAGNRVVIPNLTGTGTNNYTFGQAPTTMTTTLNGHIQIYGAGGTLISDHTHNGMLTFTTIASGSFKIDGTLNTMDPRDSSTAMVTATGLARTTSCSRPTGGMLKVVRTGGAHPGTFNWTFGPACGAATFDGNSETLPVSE